MTIGSAKNILIILAGFLLFGCAGTPAPERALPHSGSSVTSSRPAAPKTTKPAPSVAAVKPITSTYTLKSLLGAMFRYQEAYMSFDYFPQFTTGDAIFEDYVYGLFGSERTPYHLGEGTVLTVRREGTPILKLERSLVQVKDDGSRWWQVKQTMQDQTIEYAVRVHRFGVPLQIRFLDPQSGKKVGRSTVLSGNLDQALASTTADRLKAAIGNDIQKRADRGLQKMFEKPEVVGIETVTVPAGAFSSVHVHDIQQAGAFVADYWLSPDVPGGILKFSLGHPGEKPVLVGTLDAITNGNSLAFMDAQTVSASPDSEGQTGSQPSADEGSAQSPVVLSAGDSHNGAVAAGGTSYYRIDVKRRADITVELTGFEGSLKLQSFGPDGTYKRWTAESSGSSPDLQYYFAEPGSSLYFTVVNNASGQKSGDSYELDVSESRVLDPTGVEMKGDIFSEARELPAGTTRDVLTDGLNYYKFTVHTGSVLKVVAEGLPEGAELSWLDVRGGSYSGVSTSGSGTRTVMTVSGLKPGDECFFYVSGGMDGAADSFSLKIGEQ